MRNGVIRISRMNQADEVLDSIAKDYPRDEAAILRHHKIEAAQKRALTGMDDTGHPALPIKSEESFRPVLSEEA